MEHLGEAIKFAKKEGARFIENLPNWKGCEIWQLYMEDPREPTESSLPTFLMFGKKPRLMTDKEAHAYMRFLDEKYGYEDDESTLKGWESELIPIR